MNYEDNDISTARHFRACQQCGQLTPAESPECAHCGARSLLSVADVTQARSEERFIRAFLARATPVTYAIFGFNLAVFLLMSLLTVYPLERQLVYGADPLTLVAFGAKTNALLHQGEWFRLVTPIFIHIGLMHLASNSYVFWMIGPTVERLYGSARFLLIYLLSGIGGVVGSYFGHLSSLDPTIPGAGASGAIFGLCGVLLVFGYKYRADLPPVFRRAFGAGVLPMIAINLLIGYLVPFIDNSAHVGGLMTGIVLALLIPYVRPGQERVTNSGLAVLAVCVAIVAYSFMRAYQQGGKYLPRTRPARAVTQLERPEFRPEGWVPNSSATK
ncbi:MAG TPA: rhomboid family intramembrane serine protease [Blastocatellia bacterium]|nr:rhomboid family intramembrane serine protease [Blastocatellia bacterium]